MEFGFRCITVISTKAMSGDYSRSRVFYPNEKAIIDTYKGRDRGVTWLPTYTENIHSDNFFMDGKYEVVGTIPLELANALTNVQGFISHEDGKDYLELNSRVLEIIRIWKYDK